jgi:hypothetical protein
MGFRAGSFTTNFTGIRLVDLCGCSSGLGDGGLGGLGFLGHCAHGEHAQDHYHCQKQGKQFLHIHHSLVLLLT